MVRKINGGGNVPCGSKKCKIPVPSSLPRTPSPMAVNNVERIIIDPHNIHLEEEDLIDDETGLIKRAGEMSEEIKTAISYLVKAVKDRNEYIQTLIDKNKPKILSVILQNFNELGKPYRISVSLHENKIGRGQYNEQQWVGYLRFLKFNLTLLKTQIEISRLSHIITNIQKMDILYTIEKRLEINNIIHDIKTGGATHIKRFKVALRKYKKLYNTHLKFPKKYFVKKSDSKTEKLYILEHPEYEKVVLLKDKSNISAHFDCIKVSSEVIEWLEKRIAKK